MTNFYFDDYNLITTEKTRDIEWNDIKILVNDKEMEYVSSADEYNFCFKLKEDFNEKNQYKISVSGREYEILPRFIVQSDRFDKEYFPDLNILGSFVRSGKGLFAKKETVFRLWAPLSKSAKVVSEFVEYPMEYIGKGIYECHIEEDLEGKKYFYKVEREKTYCFKDPFAYLDASENESFVIDPTYLLEKKKIVPEKRATVIYETSVRDFSSDDAIPFAFPKKFLAFTEKGLTLKDKPVGLDYLKTLGISHIQLMPVFSFNIDKTDYNWGYNPMTYNTLERSYLVARDASGINEFRMMVDALHKENIKVNLDVVYNHVFDHRTFNLSLMLPYYFFRYYKSGKLGNASGCGNEIRSEALFTREYLKYLTARFINIFDIDGLRFDLMGIMDYETINEIKDTARALKEDFMIYGEGWDMGDILPHEKQAIMESADKMPGVAFFNYHFREAIRGKDINDRHAFMLGDLYLKEEMKRVLNHSEDYGFNLNQTINYTECHDNYTVFDKVNRCSDNHELVDKVCAIALDLCVLAKGIPFIHSGQEFLRSKKGIDNTYNLPDSINKIHWQRKNNNEGVSNSLIDLIKIRNEYKEFFDDTVPSFRDYYEVLIYELKDIAVLINCCAFDHIYADDQQYEIIFDGKSACKRIASAVRIPSFSLVIVKKM